MLLDLSNLSPNQVYYTFIQTIIPRPVAWVLSDNGDGGYNLAPFSYFNGVSSNPPIIMLSIGKKADGSRKDTLVNIDEREDFVVHIAHRELAPQVTASSAGLPHGESELDQLKLETVAIVDETGASVSRLPRLKDARIAFVCTKERVLEIGNTPQGVVFGNVHHVYVDDAVATNPGGRLNVDAKAVDPVARIGGNDYSLFGETITIPRPK
ncbi:MAG: flavin reductase family protein [Leptospirales bacterium]|jgi:flavin reductase (DIM6/NTAB) family NADH-FMN oxidoreductase RutF